MHFNYAFKEETKNKLPAKMSHYCSSTERIPDRIVGPDSIFSNLNLESSKDLANIKIKHKISNGSLLHRSIGKQEVMDEFNAYPGCEQSVQRVCVCVLHKPF